MTDAFLSDPRITSAVTPEVLAFLRQNQPAPGADPDTEIGHWIAVTACVLDELAKAKQKIRELEADA
ncbi:hypothetical protein PV772_08765 [Pseudarthrobacter sp. CC12]|uniref:hypothetical protein n=1 Tax=Pseudarthrobacter sp. CC12 TaxID=3029193 RepID=UPI0032648D4B